MTKVIKYEYLGGVVFETDEQLFNTYFQYPAIKTSSWYKNMTPYHPDLPSEILKESSEIRKESMIKDFMDKTYKNYSAIKSLFSVSTAKKCPAITDYLNQCLVVIAPCDIEIIVGDSGTEFKASEPSLIGAESHPSCQFVPKSYSSVLKPQGNLFGDLINLKFAIPFIFKNNKLPALFLEPVFHAVPKLKVLNAAIVKDHAINHTFQLNTFANKNEGLIKFKKGDALAYVWYPEKVKFERSKTHLASPIAHSFKLGRTNSHIK